jgi:hypothetical protein
MSLMSRTVTELAHYFSRQSTTPIRMTNHRRLVVSERRLVVAALRETRA